jgi:hypothetical protein
MTLPFPSSLLDSLLDVCGKLEGENIVHASISGSSDHPWNLEEIPSSPTSPPPVVSPSPNSPSNTATPSTTSSASDDSFQDWREPIRRRLSKSLETGTNMIMVLGPFSNFFCISCLLICVFTGRNDILIAL